MQERLQTILENQQKVYKKIEDTYATKEELEEALENIPTGEGGTITIDQKYNPESKNAQSGKALAPELQRKIGYWQPNTEYKEEDVCYWDKLANGYPSGHSVFLKCKFDHTSSEYTDPLSELNKWTVLQISADRSVCDAQGEAIHETYATKDYVDSHLGSLSGGIVRIIVDTLPTEPSEINENAIYMIPSQNGAGNNIYDEYMFFNFNNGGFPRPEIIGSTAVDLSNYYTKAEIAEVTQAFVTKEEVGNIETELDNIADKIENLEGQEYLPLEGGGYIYNKNDPDVYSGIEYNRIFVESLSTDRAELSINETNDGGRQGELRLVDNSGNEVKITASSVSGNDTTKGSWQEWLGIGNIEAVLDELHNYAQTLITEGVEQ